MIGERTFREDLYYRLVITSYSIHYTKLYEGTKRLSASTRIVSATNKDLEGMIGERTFREDLYYRLSVVKVKVPSLSERRDDILLLARYFLVEFSRKFGKSFDGISPEAEEALQSLRWRGNVRELRNTMERRNNFV